MMHILTDWKISNCDGVSRGLAPWVAGGTADSGSVGLFTIPANGFAPEVQLISKGTTYDWATLGGYYRSHAFSSWGFLFNSEQISMRSYGVSPLENRPNQTRG